MKLDLTSLEKSVSQLRLSLQYYESDLAKQDEGIKVQFRMSAIQAFEYTYELCCKMLRRYLEMSEDVPGTIDEMSFPDLIRTASERNLLRSDWRQWKEYRKTRNITAHTYDDSKAEAAIAIIPDFLSEAEYLLNILKGKSIDV